MRWIDIEGFEGLYQISDTGLVKSCERNIQNNYTGIQKKKEKILKPEFTKDGYLRITLSKDSKQYRYPIHTLVAQAFLKNPNLLNIINHKDENKSNNHYTNLEWCDYKYNLEYSISRYYVAIDPFGTSHNVFNLSDFCKTNNLSLSAMSEMATGRIAKGKKNPRLSHKGWKCFYLDNKPKRGVMKHDC